MFDVSDTLRDALARERGELHDAQAALARAATAGNRSADAAMARTAQAAIFSEALLAAEHARLAELKGVSK